MAAIKKSPVASIRQRALKKFEQVGFPKPKCEEYRHTPVTQALSGHFNEAEQTAQTPSKQCSITPFLLDAVSNNQLVFINGKFSKTLSRWDYSTKISISSLREAATTHPHQVAAHLARYEDGKDPFSLFNTARWHDGAFVHVPQNTTLSKPLIIYYLHDAQQKKVAAHTRLLVVVAPHSKLDIIEKTDSIGTHPVFNTVNEEIVVQEHATLNYCKIQNDKGMLHKITNTYIHQSNASKIKTHVFTLDGKLIRNNLTVQIDGELCKSYLYGLYLGQHRVVIDNQTIVDHRKPNSYSNELYKGIIGENAQGTFNGKIYVRPQAQQTNAFQSNRNILLADTSTIHAKPQLEIWADDVKCSHGCTSGQLDGEALFYLQSRGIAKSTAQAMLLHAFAGETFNSIEDGNLKEAVRRIVSQHLKDSFEL